jgi:hypothetical protein
MWGTSDLSKRLNSVLQPLKEVVCLFGWLDDREMVVMAMTKGKEVCIKSELHGDV